MKYNKSKIIFVVILGLIIVTASFFMITESARYYTFFYESGAWQPLYLAGLLELFVLVLATIKIGAKKTFHLIQKMIMIGVFTVIIFAAGMQAVNPTLETVAQFEQKEKLAGILEEEYKTLKKDREVFEKQRQKGNTAIAAAERRKIVEDLKSLFSQDVKTDTGRVALINILLLFTIRFLVQMSNVFCASMLGVYFRGDKQKISKRTEKDIILELYPSAVCKMLPIHGANFVFKDSKDTSVSSEGTLGKGLTAKKAWEAAYKNLGRTKK